MVGDKRGQRKGLREEVSFPSQAINSSSTRTSKVGSPRNDLERIRDGETNVATPRSSGA